MQDLWTQALREAMASPRAMQTIIHTLRMVHPALPEGEMCLAQSPVDIDVVLEDQSEKTFMASNFNLTLPSVDAGGVQELGLQLDNTDRVSAVLENVELSGVPVEMQYRAFLSDDLSVPQTQRPLILFLKDVRYTSTVVTARASFADLVNRPFLSHHYTTVRFPGLAVAV